jgi:hypothetical protein
MRDTFQNWLINTENKKHSTAYSYALAINRLSKHYSEQLKTEINIYAIDNIQLLEKVANKYDIKGIYSEYGNYGNGTNRAAIIALCRFRGSTKEFQIGTKSNQKSIPKSNGKKEVKIFKFKDNSTIVEKDLAILLGRVSHHIHPDIVAKIAKENIKFKTKFEKHCHPNLKLEDYFYHNSDCVFPGVRRQTNSEMVGNWKNNIKDTDGNILNDNTYPRHIWTYLSANKGYSGGTNGIWSESGLNLFELAHVFSHKIEERILEPFVFEQFEESSKPYALFTSASNVVLIPKGMAKPTDKMTSIKLVFYKRHLDLYGNNLIGLNNFNESEVPDWYEDITWQEPILPDNWEEKIDKLLTYREEHLLKKYSKLTTVDE